MALGAVIFSDAKRRAQLDGMMQPLPASAHSGRDGSGPSGRGRVRRAGYAALYEAGLDTLCDRVWCVSLPREMQVQRLMARDGFTRAEAEARLSSQMDAAEKARRADVVIDTSGSIQYTRDQIPALLEDERRQMAK